MGAFLLYRTEVIKLKSEGTRLTDALTVFERTGVPSAGLFILGDFTLHLYRKKYLSDDNHIQFENGDFIASTGCLIYSGDKGTKALQGLYHDFLSQNRIEDKCMGN